MADWNLWDLITHPAQTIGNAQQDQNLQKMQNEAAQKQVLSDIEFEDYKRKQEYLDPFEKEAMNNYQQQKISNQREDFNSVDTSSVDARWKAKDAAQNPMRGLSVGVSVGSGKDKGSEKKSGVSSRVELLGNPSTMTRNGPKQTPLTRPEEIYNSIADQYNRTGRLTQPQEKFISEKFPHMAGNFGIGTDETKMSMQEYEKLMKLGETDAKMQGIEAPDKNQVQEFAKKHRDAFAPGKMFPGENPNPAEKTKFGEFRKDEIKDFGEKGKYKYLGNDQWEEVE